MSVQAHPRKLTPLQEDTVRALCAGLGPCPTGTRGDVSGCIHDDLAKRYGVSKRTILRTIERTPLRVEIVTLSGWYAQFEITDDGPVQRTDWRAVA